MEEGRASERAQETKRGREREHETDRKKERTFLSSILELAAWSCG